MIQLDNGRTKVVADKVGRAALHCIRCSACLDVRPGSTPAQAGTPSARCIRDRSAPS
jgi:hypothetical protein